MEPALKIGVTSSVGAPPSVFADGEGPDRVSRRQLKDELLQARRDLALRDALLREVNHRTKNALQLATSLLRVQASRTKNIEAREGLAAASQRLLAMASTHSILPATAGSDIVSVPEHLATLCTALSEGAGVEIEFRCESLACPRPKAMFIGLLIAEAVLNAAKHAFPDGRRGTVAVELGSLADGLWQLSVRDDGIGPGTTTSDGLGAKLMASFGKSLGGIVSVGAAPGGGTVVTLAFPMQDAGAGRQVVATASPLSAGPVPMPV